MSYNIPKRYNSCGFNHSNISDYSDFSTEIKFKIDKIEMFAEIGAHIDAPSHSTPDGPIS